MVVADELAPGEWWRAIRNRARLVIVLAVLGLLGALTYGLGQPAMSTARATVLMPPAPTEAGGPSVRDINTQVQIILSPIILGSAGHAADPNLSYSSLKGLVTVDAITSDVLQITAHGATVGLARRLANDVATRFVAFTTTSSSALVTAATQELQEKAGQLQNQITALLAEINSLTSMPTVVAGQQAQLFPLQAQLLLALREAELNDSLQLEDVNSQITDLTANVLNSGVGTIVLARAETVPTSALRIPVLVTVGSVGGLLVGAEAAVILERRSRRHRGADSADSVGGAVLSSLPPPRAERRATDPIPTNAGSGT